MKPSERLRQHVTAIAAIVQEMSAGEPRDRVQQRLDQVQADYEAVKAKEES